MSSTSSGFNPTNSNANVGRNTGDPSGMQPPDHADGALSPSSGEEPQGRGSWITAWIVVALVILGGIVWWLVASDDNAKPAGIPDAQAAVSAPTWPSSSLDFT